MTKGNALEQLITRNPLERMPADMRPVYERLVKSGRVSPWTEADTALPLRERSIRNIEFMEQMIAALEEADD